jgi:hypothetical protein
VSNAWSKSSTNSPNTAGSLQLEPDYPFSGTDAHGQMQVTLFSNGAFNFNGSFTDPDIYDLDDSLVFMIASRLLKNGFDYSVS